MKSARLISLFSRLKLKQIISFCPWHGGQKARPGPKRFSCAGGNRECAFCGFCSVDKSFSLITPDIYQSEFVSPFGASCAWREKSGCPAVLPFLQGARISQKFRAHRKKGQCPKSAPKASLCTCYFSIRQVKIFLGKFSKNTIFLQSLCRPGTENHLPRQACARIAEALPGFA